MDHVAIMNKKMGYIESIVNCTKVIESRWYKNKIAPWNRIVSGDEIYFKDSGMPVTAKATVQEIIQIDNLNEDKFKYIVKKYGDLIQLKDRTYSDYYKSKNYVILIFLKNPEYLEESFNISKQGYGNACAWICVRDIRMIKK